MQFSSVRLLMAAAAATLLASCSEDPIPAPAPRPVKTVVIKRAPIAEIGSLAGEIKARYESDLGFRIGGKVLARPVDVGSVVERSALLARLDDANERNSVRTAEAQVAAATAESQDAAGNEARQRELLEKGATSRAIYDAAARRLKTAQANLTSAQISLSNAKERLAYTELHADEAGVITAVAAQPGQVVSAGQMIVRLALTGAKEALFNVSESMFRNAPVDPLIEVSLLSDPNVKSTGRVREVSPSADPVTRTFAVRVALENPPEMMLLGSPVVGRVLLEAQQVATLPPAALFRDEGKPAVWVFDPATSTVNLRPVGVLRYENDRMLISSGLMDGERVVVAGVQKLRPGLKVRLLEGGSK